VNSDHPAASTGLRSLAGSRSPPPRAPGRSSGDELNVSRGPRCRIRGRHRTRPSQTAAGWPRWRLPLEQRRSRRAADQAVQRSLIGTLALVVDQGHHPAPDGAASPWLAHIVHVETVALHGLEPRAVCAMAREGAYFRAPTSGCHRFKAGTTASPAETAVKAPWRSSLRHWKSRLAETPSFRPPARLSSRVHRCA
jgi:hypothetical protein